MKLKDIYLYNDASLEEALKKNSADEILVKLKNFIVSIDIDKLYNHFINKEMNEVIKYCEVLKKQALELELNRFVKDFDYIIVVLENEAYTFLHYALSKLDMDYQCLQKSLA